MRLISQHPVDLDEGAVLKLWHYRVAPGERDEAHDHPWSQLDWSPTGILTVDVDDRSWVVPPSVAFWVPRDRKHAVGASQAADLRHVTFYPRAESRLATASILEPAPIAMTPFMCAVLERLAEPGLTRRERGRLGAVFIDAMTPVHRATLELPLPSDERASAITGRLRNDPADPRTLDEWGALVGASRRTLVRVFRAETGLTFNEWRTRARIGASLPALANGAAVATAGRNVGYTDASAYIAAFRRVLGTTPRDYQRMILRDRYPASPASLVGNDHP